MATIIGEVAASESIEHLLAKCKAYMAAKQADIVIGVKIPGPLLVDGELRNPDYIWLYVWYDTKLPEPLKVHFDVPFSFDLKVKNLEKKIDPKRFPGKGSIGEVVRMEISIKNSAIFPGAKSHRSEN